MKESRFTEEQIIDIRREQEAGVLVTGFAQGARTSLTARYPVLFNRTPVPAFTFEYL